MNEYEVIDGCRSCGENHLQPVLSLGDMPLSDGFLEETDLELPEAKYPLNVAFCPACSLVQLMETVAPQILFGSAYPYYSSFTESLLAHSRDNAVRLIESRALGKDHLVVELASNDGYMLRNFAAAGIRVLGIDPAEGPARTAQALGIPTICDFFGQPLARRLVREDARADVVIANNVLAHVSDLGGFVHGIASILKEDGLAVIEVPYVRDLVESCEFDTIYHEHLCYFSVTSLVKLFEQHNLLLNDVEHYPIHGGSLRLYVSKKERPGDSLLRYLAEEQESGLVELSYYSDFAERVGKIQRHLLTMLMDLKQAGNCIAGYGAAAKGTILLNSSGVGKDIVSFVVDRNIHKQGLFVPGVHVPIFGPETLLEERPQYVVLLTWNLKDEVFVQQREYRAQGGKFVIPIPYPEVA